MRKIAILLSAAAAFGMTHAATAADLGAKVYRKAPPVPVYTWTGSYIGAYVGGAGSASDSYTSNPVTGAGVFGVTTVPVGASSVFDTGSGFIGGITSGYNYQFAPNWLIGYESETGYQKIRGQSNYPGSATAFAFSRSDDWYSSWTARFGYISGQSLFYVKGGATLTRFENFVSDSAGPGGALIGQEKKYRVGYAIGGGWEYALDPKWSIKAEYLYLGFGGDQNFNAYDLAGNTYNVSTKIEGIHTGKIGVNYKWDPLALIFAR